MGELPAGPGSAAFQRTFSVGEKVAGSPEDGADPSKWGPRQWGQSLPHAGAIQVTRRARMVRFMGF